MTYVMFAFCVFIFIMNIVAIYIIYEWISEHYTEKPSQKITPRNNVSYTTDSRATSTSQRSHSHSDSEVKHTSKFTICLKLLLNVKEGRCNLRGTRFKKRDKNRE